MNKEIFILESQKFSKIRKIMRSLHFKSYFNALLQMPMLKIDTEQGEKSYYPYRHLMNKINAVNSDMSVVYKN